MSLKDVPANTQHSIPDMIWSIESLPLPPTQTTPVLTSLGVLAVLFHLHWLFHLLKPQVFSRRSMIKPTFSPPCIYLHKSLFLALLNCFLVFRPRQQPVDRGVFQTAFCGLTESLFDFQLGGNRKRRPKSLQPQGEKGL